MAIVVECASCGRVTHFADNDAGLAVSCVNCGQRARVPNNRPKPAPPPQPAPPPPKLTRVKPSPGRPMIYAAGLLLVLGTASGLGYLKYRAVVTDRNHASPAAAAPTKSATVPSANQSLIAATPVQPATVDSARAAQAVAARKVEGPARAIGFVGLDRLELNGRYVVDSYNALTLPYRAGAARAMAPLLSNLKVRLNGEARIAGIIRVGKSGDIRRAPAVTVTPPPAADRDGESASQKLPAPPVNALAAKAANDNHLLPEKYYQGKSLFVHARKTVAVPAGVYGLRDLLIEPGATLVLDGPVTFVVSGRLIIYGSVETHDRLPVNLRVWVDGPDETVTIDTPSELYVDLYAPRRTVEIAGKGDLYGSVVGKILRMSGERGLHFDESIPPVLEPIASSPARDR